MSNKTNVENSDGGNNKAWYKKLPHVYVILMFIIALGALLSYLVPAGEFERTVIEGRQAIVPDSFHYTNQGPVSFLDIFLAVVNGMISAASIIFLVIILGGSIEIFQKTKAIKIAISKSILKFGDKDRILIIVAMIFFSILGAFLGWAEGAIPFVPLAVALAIGLGYDSMVGVGIAVVATMGSFALGPTNPYTVGVAHKIAELPLFSGALFRTAIYIIFLIIGIHHVLKYAKTIKKDPSKSLMSDIDTSSIEYNVEEYEGMNFNNKHILVLLILALTIFFALYGIFAFGWYINEMAAVFLLGSIISGLLFRYSGSEMANTFIEGAKKVLSGALVIGFARGIQWILEQGNIADTIIHALSTPLKEASPYISAVGMFFVHSIINFFIPSGSGQAMATMPIMIPLSDVIGVTRQTAILAFQFGDGFANLMYPTVGALLVYLAFGNVPFDRWLRFVGSLMLKIFVISIISLLIAVRIGYGPF